MLQGHGVQHHRLKRGVDQAQNARDSDQNAGKGGEKGFCVATKQIVNWRHIDRCTQALTPFLGIEVQYSKKTALPQLYFRWEITPQDSNLDFTFG